MYESPIELIYKDAQYKLEEGIYKAIQKFDIKVDREELIKALEYDRRQYSKGYEDAKAEQKKGEWEEKTVFDEPGLNQYQSARCSACGLYHTTPYSYYFYNYKYCPYCGADMRGAKDAEIH